MADVLGPDNKPMKQLEGWISLPEIAENLGFTKQGVHWMVFTDPVFDPEDLRYVGRPSAPMFLVRESAWQAELDRRERVARQREAAKAETEREAAEQARLTELRRRMRALLGEAGIMGKQPRVDYVSKVLGQAVDDWYSRSAEEATKVIKALERGRR